MSLRMQDVSNTKLVRKLLPFFTKKHPVHGQVATQDASDKTIVGFVHVERRESGGLFLRAYKVWCEKKSSLKHVKSYHIGKNNKFQK